VASAGQVISDIVSVKWSGDVGPLSEQIITLTVLVDPYYEGLITNTAVISHHDLSHEVWIQAVAYVTDDPVLFISKSATPDPVPADSELKYTIRVRNLGQLATGLIITDAIPDGTSYVPGSATGGGLFLEDGLVWQTTVLQPGESQEYTFRVEVGRGRFVVNDRYGVVSAEGVSARGTPVVTTIVGGQYDSFLPVIRKP
jgi:uncharacterized repeat protein (TIGR01451 family)